MPITLVSCLAGAKAINFTGDKSRHRFELKLGQEDRRNDELEGICRGLGALPAVKLACKDGHGNLVRLTPDREGFPGG